jgi:diaminohydroxyphosphoribosylaminopyrimidine deaminase/5-amino-6-(5-phosphoribosylamino)uracil reductase
VYAVDDPNPLVAGGGARILTDAGVEVASGVLADEAELLNEAFFGVHRNGRPWVVAKIAQTLDGRIATRTGDSQWISGVEARTLAHRLRADADAVIVGMGTVLADDPALTVRHVDGDDPYRIVVTTSLDLPGEAGVVANNDDRKTIVATSGEVAAEMVRRGMLRGVSLWEVRTGGDGWVDPGALVEKAGEAGMQSLLLEGGSALLTSFLRAGVVDKYVQITAPKIIGKGLSGVGDLGIRTLGDAVLFDRARFETLGDDVVFTGYPRGGA